MGDARVSQNCFIKIAILVRTGRVWTSKASFVEGLSLFFTTVERVNPFVREPDVNGRDGFKGITSIFHKTRNKRFHFGVLK